MSNVACFGNAKEGYHFVQVSFKDDFKGHNAESSKPLKIRSINTRFSKEMVQAIVQSQKACYSRILSFTLCLQVIEYIQKTKHQEASQKGR